MDAIEDKNKRKNQDPGPFAALRPTGRILAAVCAAGVIAICFFLGSSLKEDPPESLRFSEVDGERAE